MLDLADDETLESVDVTPGADPDAESGTPMQRRLRGFLKRARAGGQRRQQAEDGDHPGEGLLADGFAPIVFCRFIDTAEYVAEHLGRSLGGGRPWRASPGRCRLRSGSSV